MLEAVDCGIHFPVSQLFAGLSWLELELGGEEVSGSGIAYFPVFLHIINTITIMTTANPVYGCNGKTDERINSADLLSLVIIVY